MKKKENKPTTEEPKIDWNIWHKPVMDSILQIDWDECAKVINFQRSLDPENDFEEIMGCDIMGRVLDDVETAIKGLLKEKCESFFVGGAYSYVRAWAPGKEGSEFPGTCS